MFITTSVVVNPQAAVPTEGRAAWLSKYGPVHGTSAVVSVTLSGEAWESLGVPLTPNAEAVLLTTQTEKLSAAVLEFIAETGAVPSSFPADRAVAALQG